MQLELERTFLAKYLPPNILQQKVVDLLDIYIPRNASHPILRIRKRGEVYEITKKFPQGNDTSEHEEHTITLTQEEFTELSILPGKRVHKLRYYYSIHGKTAEIDVFQDELKGLVLIDVEFDSKEEKKTFIAPDFCLADITQEEFIAGGYLAGRTYKDIELSLNSYNYRKILI